jgi:phosphoglycolate phosphatase
MEYKSIIFDLDGTLIESTANHIDWIYKCCEEALEAQKVDKTISKEDLGKLLGMDGYRNYISVCNKIGVDPAKHWEIVTELRHQKKLEMLNENELDLYPETEKIIKNLHDQDLKIGLVSNSPDKTVNEIIDFFDLKRYIEYYRGISDHEDLNHRKPSARNLKIASTEISRAPYVYVGNKKEDIKAAEKANMDSIIVERSNTGLDADPDILVESLSDILSRLN